MLQPLISALPVIFSPRLLVVLPTPRAQLSDGGLQGGCNGHAAPLRASAQSHAAALSQPATTTPPISAEVVTHNLRAERRFMQETQALVACLVFDKHLENLLQKDLYSLEKHPVSLELPSLSGL